MSPTISLGLIIPKVPGQRRKEDIGCLYPDCGCKGESVVHLGDVHGKAYNFYNPFLNNDI
jgi:hypothetical protein